MYKIYKNKFKKKSTVIAYGSSMTSTTKKNILHKYELKEKKYYLIVGRLIPDNNSKLICDGFIKSKSKKNIVIVGDVPYKDSYAKQIKSMANNKIIFTGYINSQENLTQLYKNCFGYIHGHEFGGTNPTMINALDLNCNIIALNTPFNREMLENKKAIFFEKSSLSISNSINIFEKTYNTLNTNSYKVSRKYSWDSVTEKYLELFTKTTNFRNR